MTGAVLVIGYGNVLRMDDGLGWRVAERLADDARLSGATVIGRHQLTPELAFDVSQAGLVVFVDAALGPAAGSHAVERVRSGSGRPGSMSHQLDPAGLVALANELYDAAPEVFLVSVGAGSIEAGEDLTPAVAAALPAVLETVVELIGEWTGRAEAMVPAGRDRA